MGFFDFFKHLLDIHKPEKVIEPLNQSEIESIIAPPEHPEPQAEEPKVIPPSEEPIPENEAKYYQPENYYTHNAFSNSVITFENRKKTTFPSKNGLYVAEILLLQYCSYGTYPHPRNGYPGFWWFEYGIRNVGAVLKSLETRGFIRYVSAVESLPRYTIPQLKELLALFGLPARGKKADLIDTLCNNVPENQLELVVKERKYRLTALGQKELAENAYVPYMHCHPHKTLGDDPDDPSAFNVWVINHLIASTDKSNWKSICDQREYKRDTHLFEYTQSLYRSLEQSDPDLAKKLSAQDKQLEEIKAAESRYSASGNIIELTVYWEALWAHGGLLFNGAHWTFRLADLYIKQERYEDALQFVKNISNPIYHDKAQKYVKNIESLMKKA